MSGNRIYVEAYELKAGGFRGVAKDCRTGEIQRGDVRPTLDEARNDAKRFAEKMLGGLPYAGGSYRNTRHNWKFNYWTHTAVLKCV
jgi:hypothetical protein